MGVGAGIREAEDRARVLRLDGDATNREYGG